MKFIATILLMFFSFVLSDFGQDLTKVEKSTDFPRLNRLRKLSETPLPATENETDEAYRLVIWPTFYGPISIRIEKKKKVIRLTAKKLRGAGGYEVWDIESKKEIVLSDKQLQLFKRLLTKADFIRMPTRETRFDERDDGTALICLDGAEWILEQVVDGKHHIIERYCSEDMNLHKIVFQLVEFSKLKIPKAELF